MTKEAIIWFSISAFWAAIALALFLIVPLITYNEPERVTATCITAYLTLNRSESHIICGEIYDAT